MQNIIVILDDFLLNVRGLSGARVLYANRIDLVKSFSNRIPIPTSDYLQKSGTTQPRTNRLKLHVNSRLHVKRMYENVHVYYMEENRAYK